MKTRAFLAALVLCQVVACLDARFGGDGGCYRGERCALPWDAGGQAGNDGDASTEDGGSRDAGEGFEPDASCDNDPPVSNPSFAGSGVQAPYGGESGVEDNAPTFAQQKGRFCFFKDRLNAAGIYCAEGLLDGGNNPAPPVAQRYVNSLPVSGETLRWAGLSPDGAELIVSVQSPATGSSRLYRTWHHPTFGYGYSGRERLFPQVMNPNAPAFSPDNKELYFTDTTGPSWRIYVAERIADGGFTNPRPVENIHPEDGGLNFNHTISPDGRFMIFDTVRGGSPIMTFYISERRCGLWQRPEPFPVDSGRPGSYAAHPEFGPEGTLLFVTDDGTAANKDIFMLPPPAGSD